MGMTGLLLDTELSEEQRQFADLIHSSGKALLELVEHVLDFSEMDAGKVQLELVDFAPVTLVSEVMELLREQARGKGIELVQDVDPRLDRVLGGDAARLEQALVILMGNAIKFTEAGRVAIHVGLVGETADDVMARFDVRDTGPGIAPDDRGRLFEPFTQGDDSSTRRHGGMGLGLAVCRNLVELMGGEIGVESELGKGSTFWFSTSLRKARAPAGDAAAA